MMGLGSGPKLVFPGLAGFYASAQVWGYTLVRITIGLILFVHGWGKLMGPGLDGVTGMFGKMGLAPAGGFAITAIFLETAGALCVAVGLFTRFFAAALAIEMLVAMLMVHLPKGFGVSAGGYEYVLLLGIVLFAIALRGGGPYSVDQKFIGKEL
jgi:putative oxidoreductase